MLIHYLIVSSQIQRRLTPVLQLWNTSNQTRTMSVIFQQARILNPLEHLDLTGTIKVADNGVIEAIAYGNETLAASPQDRVLDLRGKIVAPGLFDMHCHFREPGQ